VRTAESSYEQALLQEMAARTALRLARTAIQQNLEQAKSDYETAQADDDNARQTLKLLGEPAADGSLRVTAPSAGVVVERDVNPGQVVDQSQETPWQMFVVSNASTVWVDADVYEQDIESIHPGQNVRIRVTALPNHTFTGRVLRIAPTLDTKSRAIKARTEIDNRAGLLKDGMFADVTIQRPKGKTMPVIPVEAVQHDGDKDYVYVAINGKYAKREVKLGTQRAGQCDVLDGVKPGEVVVTHGALFLGDQNNSD
jgi:cobalt-zinc-cadmium efflux system membrane fusion protein